MTKQIQATIKKERKRRQNNIIAKEKRKTKASKRIEKTTWDNILSNKTEKENCIWYYRDVAAMTHFGDYINGIDGQTFKAESFPQDKLLNKPFIRQNWQLLSILTKDELKKEMRREKNRCTLWVRDPAHRSKIKEKRTKERAEKKKKHQLALEAKERANKDTEKTNQESTQTNLKNKKGAASGAAAGEEKKEKTLRKNPNATVDDASKPKKEKKNKEKLGKKRKRPAAVAAALEEVTFDRVIARAEEEEQTHTAKRKKISNVRLLKQLENANTTEEERRAMSMASAMRTATSGRDKMSASVLRSKIKKHHQRKNQAGKKWAERQAQAASQKKQAINKRETNLANKKNRGREGFEGKKQLVNSASKLKKAIAKKKKRS